MGSKGIGSAWDPEKRPSWWDQQHWSSESPNNGTLRMSVDALDALLCKSVAFYKRIRAGEETNEEEEANNYEERMSGKRREEHQQILSNEILRKRKQT